MTVVHATASFNDIRNGLESLDGAKANQVRASAIVVLVNCVAPANGGSMSSFALFMLFMLQEGAIAHPKRVRFFYCGSAVSPLSLLCFFIA